MRRKSLFYFILILLIFSLKNGFSDTSKKESVQPHNTKEVSYCYYDESNRCLAIEDLRGLTKYEYDEKDRISKIIFPDNKEISFGYNEKGNLQNILYPDDKQTTYEYDANNKLCKVIDSSGETEIEHTQGNLLSKISHPNGIVSEFVYDQKGRIFSTVHKGSDEKLIIGFNYEYDDKDNLINEKKITTSSVVETTYSEDKNIKRKQCNGFSVEYQSNDEGRLLKQIRPDKEIIYYYDENGLLLQAGDVDYFYDDNGNIIHTESPNGSANLTYDTNNRLIKYEDKENTVEYFYNADNQLMKRIANGFETNFYKDNLAPISSLLYKTTEKDDFLAKAVYQVFGGKDTDENSYVYGDSLLHCFAENNPIFYLLTKQRGDVSCLIDKHKKIRFDKENESIYKPLLESRLHVSTYSKNIYTDPISHLFINESGQWIDYDMYVMYNSNPRKNVIKLSIDQLGIKEEPPVVIDEPKEEPPIVIDEPKEEPKEEPPVVIDEPKEEPPVVIDEPKEEPPVVIGEPKNEFSLEDAVASINDPLGMVYDEENNQLILFGYENQSLPKASYNIFAAAMQTMNTKGQPMVSLMTNNTQISPLHIYIGNIIKRAGDLFFALALEENALHQKMNPNISGYQSLAKLFIDNKLSGSKTFEMQLQPESMSLITSINNNCMMINDVKIGVRAEEQTIKNLHPEFVSDFANHISSNFNKYTNKFTEWARFLYLVKVIQIAKWVNEQDLAVQEEAPILNIKMPYHFTSPNKTYQWTEQKERIKVIKRKKWYGTRKREKKVKESVTRYLTLSLEGGVDASCEDTYTTVRDNMMQTIKAEIMKAKEDSNKLCWDFTMPNNKKAVAVVLNVE